MSVYNTSDQNGIDCSDDEQQLTREELMIQLRLEELKRTQLRRRLDRLEDKVGVEPDSPTDKMEAMEADYREQLDEEADDE